MNTFMETSLSQQFYTFSSWQRLNFNFAIAEYSLGILGNTILILLWWKHQHDDIDRFSIIIISTDLLGIGSLILQIMAVSLEGFNDNRYGSGVYQCLALGIGGFVLCLTNLLGVTLYAYQRYRIIFQKEPLPLSSCFAIQGCYFLFCLLICISGIYIGTPYNYKPVGTYCLFDWKSKSPPIWLPIIFGCIAIVGCLSSLFYMYYQILKCLRRIARDFEEDSDNKTADSQFSVVTDVPSGVKAMAKDFSAIEKTLVKRVIIIVFVCFFCYFPYFLECAYEFLTGNQVSAGFDAFAADLIIACGLLDFLVFITTNAAYRRIFWGLFRIRLQY